MDGNITSEINSQPQAKNLRERINTLRHKFIPTQVERLESLTHVERRKGINNNHTDGQEYEYFVQRIQRGSYSPDLIKYVNEERFASAMFFSDGIFDWGHMYDSWQDHKDDWVNQHKYAISHVELIICLPEEVSERHVALVNIAKIKSDEGKEQINLSVRVTPPEPELGLKSGENNKYVDMLVHYVLKTFSNENVNLDISYDGSSNERFTTEFRGTASEYVNKIKTGELPPRIK